MTKNEATGKEAAELQLQAELLQYDPPVPRQIAKRFEVLFRFLGATSHFCPACGWKVYEIPDQALPGMTYGWCRDGCRHVEHCSFYQQQELERYDSLEAKKKDQAQQKPYLSP